MKIVPTITGFEVVAETEIEQGVLSMFLNRVGKKYQLINGENKNGSVQKVTFRQE